MSLEQILSRTASYYSAKLSAHGTTARGVDWNSADSQALRFDQLLKVCDPSDTFTLNDYGCGYGALAGFLREQNIKCHYHGFDIAADMLAAAETQHAGRPDVHFVADEKLLPVADYTVASGILNVKQEIEIAAWEDYMHHLLNRFDALSSRGFAFNALTNYADPERMRPDLYYADPLRLFDHCKRRYSRSVALLHDYPLYEFTILVRK
jgi:SAM-dependent methyltransferase